MAPLHLPTPGDTADPVTALSNISEPDAREVFLTECVAEYISAARMMSKRELRSHQYPPYASLTFGAAGMAYALWRHDPHDPTVNRWLDAAARCPDDEAWMTPVYATTLAERRQSVATGPPGLAWVRLLSAATTGRTRSAQHWSRVLTAPAADERPAELLMGTAGHLLALLIAADQLAAGPIGPLPEVEMAIDDLRTRLARTASKDWANADNIGFARGRLGVQHALLVSHRRRGETPTADEVDTLERLAQITPALRELGDALGRSWCNGVAGAVLTWVEAYRATGDACWLDLARRDAVPLTRPVASADDPGNLCCGTGGWAYACLALAQVLPDEGWHDRALDLAVHGFEQLDSSWQHGLLRGYPGLVCLALDLCTDSPRGFPLVAA